MSSLKGKKIVVIGGTSGIGLAVAQSASADGASVVVASSTRSNVDEAVKALGSGSSGDAVSVKDEADLARFFAGVGSFDHLVYTAGDWGARSSSFPIADLDLTTAADGFSVRFWGALAAVKHASGHINEGGSVVLTDGLMAHRPPKGGAVMVAMLGAIEYLTRGLAVDLAPIRVNAVCPGLIMTDRNQQLPEAAVKNFVAMSPLARGGEPGEVAEAYLYLMRAGYTTGQVLRVDGGRSVV